MLRIFSLSTLLLSSSYTWAACPDYLNVEMKALHSSKTVNICEDFGEKPMLIVNTASHCGFTPQFKGLEALHQKYKDDGLVVLGFSSNSFRQEADSEEKAAEVCYVNYGVTFQMFSEVPILGDEAHPIFKELAEQSVPPQWNFNKYLLDKDGKVVQHFDRDTRPESEEMQTHIEKLL